ncbi:phosphatase PAP2 family protein, partial [Agrobacterium burrii]
RADWAYFVIVAMVLTVIIGLSRIYLGVHYPTDVLAGWCAGAAWAMFCWILAQRFFGQVPKKLRGQDVYTRAGHSRYLLLELRSDAQRF